MTGDMALKSGDYSRAAKEFRALATRKVKGDVSVSGDLVFEAEARLCLAYIWLKDFESLSKLVPKLSLNKIYVRTLVTLIDRLRQVKYFSIANELCLQIIKSAVEIPHFQLRFDALKTAMDINNSKSMEAAFSPEYSDFHRIHRGKNTVLYRVVESSTKKSRVLKVFDVQDKVSFSKEYFNRYFGLFSGEIILTFGVFPFPYFVMDFIAGEPLDLLLKTQVRNDGKRFCSILFQVGDSLVRFHEKGISHGLLDTKSIIITNGENVIISGFGIAEEVQQFTGVSCVSDVNALGKICVQMISGLHPTNLEKVNYYIKDIDALELSVSSKLRREPAGIVFKLCQFGSACIAFDGREDFKKIVENMRLD
jgi:hypothetical protein